MNAKRFTGESNIALDLSSSDANNTLVIGTTRRGKSLILQNEADRLGISYDDLLKRLEPSEEQKAKVRETPDTRDKTLVEITPRYKLERYLIQDAIDELSWSGIELSEQQMVVFLAETGIGATILDYNEVETTIRETMMDALAEQLLGESWPTCVGLLNKTSAPGSGFKEKLRVAAIKRGYKVDGLAESE